jgi:hypothetical protein
MPIEPVCSGTRARASEREVPEDHRDADRARLPTGIHTALNILAVTVPCDNEEECVVI